MLDFPRARARAVAALGGVAFGALAGEVACRLIEPRALAEPVILNARGEAVPLTTIFPYLHLGGRFEASDSPRSRLCPGLDVRFCYDGPLDAYLDADGCFPVRTNSLGFRDEEFSIVKPAGQTRVLAVGDSFTFGSGVRAEDTWVEQLEAQLGAELGDVQVVNAGFAAGAYSAGDYAEWIAADGLALTPDLVVVGLCLNDLGEIPMALIPPRVADPWLRGASHLLVHLQQRLSDRAFERCALPDSLLVLQHDPGPWRAVQSGLVRTRDACAARGVPLLVAVFPMLVRLEPESYPLLGLHQTIEQFCTREGIAVVDTLAAFFGHDDRSLWAHPTDQHPSPAAHAILAQALFAPVRSALLGR